MNKLDKDYSYLEEVPVKISIVDALHKEGNVVFCDYNIGITIKNGKSNAVCINGPMSPNKHDYKKIEKTYDAVFEAAIEMIENGDITDELEIIAFGNPSLGGPVNCASGM